MRYLIHITIFKLIIALRGNYYAIYFCVGKPRITEIKLSQMTELVRDQLELELKSF